MAEGFLGTGLETGLDLSGMFGGGNASVDWLFIAIVFMIVVIGFAIIYFLYQRRSYNKTIKVYENIGGLGWRCTFIDKARLLKVGDGGEELMFMRKKKKYITAYGKKMGNNEYWFAVGQDGYWYNIVLGDLDAKLGMLDIEPIDRDMRYMHVAVRKNIADRYRKVKFMEKYGGVVVTGIFLLIALIGILLLVNKMNEALGVLGEAMRQTAIVQESTNKMLGILDSAGMLN